VWYRQNSTAVVYITAEFVICGTDSSITAVYISAEFVICGTDRAALQLFVLVLGL
jgi:hypothetical protein